jgi:hypothetical protein
VKSTWQRWGGDGDDECVEEAGNGKRSRCLAHRRNTTARDELAETGGPWVDRLAMPVHYSRVRLVLIITADYSLCSETERRLGSKTG